MRHPNPHDSDAAANDNGDSKHTVQWMQTSSKYVNE
jgi:hypothetical protein